MYNIAMEQARQLSNLLMNVSVSQPAKRRKHTFVLPRHANLVCATHSVAYLIGNSTSVLSISTGGSEALMENCFDN